MTDNHLTHTQLLDEIAALRSQVAALETALAEQTRIDHALRASKERFEKVIELLLVPVVITDAEGLPTYHNQKFTELFGYTLEDVPTLAAWWEQAYPDETYRQLVQESWERATAHAIQTGAPLTTQEWNLTCKDGSVRRVEFDMMPMGDISVVVLNDITERKQAEMQIRLNEERLTSLLALSQLRKLNQKELIDFALEEIVRLTQSSIGYLHFIKADQSTIELCAWSQAVHADCHVEGLATHYPLDHAGVWADCVRLGRPVIHNDYQNLENKKGYPDGHFHILNHASVPVYENNRIVAIVGVGNRAEPYTASDARQLALFANTMWDIFQRRQTEFALKESQERYQLLFDSMLDGYALHEIICDENGVPIDYRFLDINPAFEQMTGLTRDVIGQRILEVLPGIEPYWIETYGKVALTGVPIRFENFTGEVGQKWFEVVAFQPQKNRFATIFQDITERKRAEIAEREQRALSSALVHTAEAINSTLNYEEVLNRILEVIATVVPHDGANIMLFDEADAVFRIVQSCTCYAKNGLESPRTDIVWSLDDLPHLRTAIDDGDVLIISDTMDYPDWQETQPSARVCSYIGAPIEVDGKVIGLLNVDSTTPGFFTAQHAERMAAFAQQAAIAIQNSRMFQRLESYNEDLARAVAQRTAELSAANEELQALSRIKDAFVSNVSHELRSPITSFVLRHHLIRKSPERLEDHLAVLERETARLEHTIEDLLRLSRLDQDRVELKREPVDLTQLVKRLVEDRSLQIQQRGLTWTFEDHHELPSVNVDPGLLEQVLSIMVTNAVNYTPAGGQITVSTQVDRTEWVGFSVRDTGLGIPPEEQPRLFERFFRGTASQKLKAPGTGLGLAIAHEIIMLHQGRIDVVSAGIPGEGTIFHVWLPVNERNSAHA